MKDTTTVMVDGLSVETTDAGAQAIAKLTKDLAAARTALDTAEAKHAEDIAARDKDIAKKDAAIDDLKSKVLDEAALDAQVKERADLIAKAKSVADENYTGMSAAEIRKSAVHSKLGRDAVDGKSAEYVEARFDILVEDAGQDPVRSALRDGVTNSGRDATEAAHAKMVSDTQNAWKGEEARA